MSSATEVEWDEESSAWMLALNLYRRLRCPGCGGNMEVTTAPENEGAFRPEAPIQCFRCVGYSMSAKTYADEPHSTSFLHIVPTRPVTGRAKSP